MERRLDFRTTGIKQLNCSENTSNIKLLYRRLHILKFYQFSIKFMYLPEGVLTAESW